MISICTANYNKAKYLKVFLDSIVRYEANTVSEIVIVDDCSTDHSLEIIADWKKENPLIAVIVIQNEVNLGPAASYQKSISHATNDYIMILDSDDFLIASSLDRKLSYFQKNPQCKIIYGDGKKYHDIGQKFIDGQLNTTFFQTIFKNSLGNIQKYFHTNISNLYIPGCLVKKEFLIYIGGFDTELRSNDRVLNIRIFDHITDKAQVSYNDIPCFAYRISESNLSHRYEDMLALMLPVAHKYSEGKDKIILLSNIYYTLGMQAIRNGHKKIALQYFKESIQYHKNIKKIFVMMLLMIVPHFIIQSNIIQRNIQKLYAMIT